jgi:nitrite reductase/ring-hydroxylating ferredoxin subunit
MEILTRQQAMKLGRSKYFTGKACTHGHISERYTASGACAACVSVAAASHRANFVPEDGRKARQLAKAQLEPIRLRIFEQEAETILGYCVAITHARFPAIQYPDVVPRGGRPLPPEAGTRLYTVYVHPDDSFGLRALAKAALDAHSVNGAQIAATVADRVAAFEARDWR